MFSVFLALVCIGLAIFGPYAVSRLVPAAGPVDLLQNVVRYGFVFLAIFAVSSTSVVYVGQNEVGHVFRIYAWSTLPAGRIIAADGEKGPQADIITYGLHFQPFLNVLNHVEMLPVVDIADGNYGYLVAQDGAPLRPDQSFGDALDTFNDEKGKPVGSTAMLDARTFLTEGGQKGAQITVLPPGRYILNRYLWKVAEEEGYEIEKGMVGVVLAKVHSSVNFGNLQRAKPNDCKPTHTKDLSGSELSSPLVPVGCSGIWSESLLPNRYYINTHAYQVTKIDTRLQTWEYKGGYTKRRIDLAVDQQGNITQTPGSEKIDVPAGSADAAVLVKVEGWDVPQELRIIAQVPPDRAPFVVAGVGTLKDVEDRIITPLVRSVVRNVFGGVIQVPVVCTDEDKKDTEGKVTQKASCEKGEPLKDKDGKLILHDRPTRVFDLMENRPLLESNVENILKVEGRKTGPEILEVRLGEPAIPPELLVSRLRQQLADQLTKTYQQEKLAQDQRIQTENSRATATQQNTLVTATINVAAAKQHKEAAQLEGEGERAKLSAIAEGQKSQALVLGEERVTELRKYELLLNQVFGFANAHPDVLTAALSNAEKFVPNTVVSGGGGGIEGSIMALVGKMLDQDSGTPTNVPPAKATQAQVPRQ